MSVDTNNVLGIREVSHRRETLIAVIFFCVVRLPNFLALCIVASLDVASLGASVTITVVNPTFGLDAASSPTPSHRRYCRSRPVTNPVMPRRRQPHRTIAIAVPDPSPTPSHHAVTIAIPEVGATPSSRSIAGFHWRMVAVFWKM
jgi:hypothetical protein